MLRRFFSVRFKSAKTFANQMFGHWRGVVERKQPTKSFLARSNGEKLELARELDFRMPEDREKYDRLIFAIAYDFFKRNEPYRDGLMPKPILERVICKDILVPFGNDSAENANATGLRIFIRVQPDRIQPLEMRHFPNTGSPYRIQDYKTGFLLKEEEAKRKEQQLFCRLLTFLEFGYEADGFDFIGIPGYDIKSVEYRNNSSEMANAVSQVEGWLREAWAYVALTLDRNMQTLWLCEWKMLDPSALTFGEFRIKPGRRCERCEYRCACDIGVACSKKTSLKRLESAIIASSFKQGELKLDINIPPESKKKRSHLVLAK